MEKVTALIVATTALLGVGGTVLRWVTFRGRLRSRIEDELKILKDLPQGAARAELETHIAEQVRTLVAEEEPLTTEERWKLNWGILFTFSGLSLMAMFAVEATGQSSVLGIGILVGAGILIYGIWVVITVRYSRNVRRTGKQHAIDLEGSVMSGDSGGEEKE